MHIRVASNACSWGISLLKVSLWLFLLPISLWSNMAVLGRLSEHVVLLCTSAWGYSSSTVHGSLVLPLELLRVFFHVILPHERITSPSWWRLLHIELFFSFNFPSVVKLPISRLFWHLRCIDNGCFFLCFFRRLQLVRSLPFRLRYLYTSVFCAQIRNGCPAWVSLHV